MGRKALPGVYKRRLEELLRPEFRDALSILREETQKPRLSSGFSELDRLLEGGIEQGRFVVLHEQDVPLQSRVKTRPILDQILYRLLCNCQLSVEDYGFDSGVVLVNCGDYRGEQALLDLRFVTGLMRASGQDPSKALDRINVVSASHPDQAEKAVDEATGLVRKGGVGLVAVRDLFSLYSSDDRPPTGIVQRIAEYQYNLARLWQACSETKTALVVTVRSQLRRRRASNFPRRPALPAGTVLKHMAHVIVSFQRDDELGDVTAFLVKHPKRTPKMTSFAVSHGDSVIGTVSTPFRSQLPASKRKQD